MIMGKEISTKNVPLKENNKDNKGERRKSFLW